MLYWRNIKYWQVDRHFKKISLYGAYQQNVTPFQPQPLPVSKWAFVTFCLSASSPLLFALMPLTTVLCYGRQEETMERNSLPSSSMKCHGVFTDEYGWGQVYMERSKGYCWKDDRPSFKKSGFGDSLLSDTGDNELAREERTVWSWWLGAIKRLGTPGI